jgi:hypothetical protein
MSSIAAVLRPVPIPKPNVLRSDPAAQAFMLLRIAFTVAPILFGLDKFAEVLTDDWTRYLATEFNDIIPGSAQDAMYMVGAVEIVAGLVVLFSPRFGGLTGKTLLRLRFRQMSPSSRAVCGVCGRSAMKAPLSAPADVPTRRSARMSCS